MNCIGGSGIVARQTLQTAGDESRIVYRPGQLPNASLYRRALKMARSGECKSESEIRRRLTDEGYTNLSEALDCQLLNSLHKILKTAEAM
jgi:hypothetical protein